MIMPQEDRAKTSLHIPSLRSFAHARGKSPKIVSALSCKALSTDTPPERRDD
jgi:hypothetical protein